MNKIDVAKIKELLSTPKSIVIIPHKNPDGDAMGSTLALQNYLSRKGHDALVIAPNDYPDFLKWLPGNEDVLMYSAFAEAATEKLHTANLIFTLDFNDLSRTGEMAHILESVDAPFVMIDHHQQPSDYAEVTYSNPQMSSTCEMVYHFMASLDDIDFLDKNIASCLYTGIMTDTGSFRFPSTTATTHKVIAHLLERGAHNAEIHQNIYDTNSISRLQLLGVALNNLEVLPELNTALITLTQRELDQHHFQKGDTEGFVNYGLSLDGIKFAVIFIENKSEGIIKMSLRSKGDFSVNKFARKHYSGGGHTNAAGGRSEKNMRQTLIEFKKIISTYKSQLIA